jgi:hypothetical protein
LTWQSRNRTTRQTADGLGTSPPAAHRRRALEARSSKRLPLFARQRPFISRLQSRLNCIVRSIARIQVLHEGVNLLEAGELALPRIAHSGNGLRIRHQRLEGQRLLAGNPDHHHAEGVRDGQSIVSSTAASALMRSSMRARTTELSVIASLLGLPRSSIRSTSPLSKNPFDQRPKRDRLTAEGRMA